MPVNLNLSKIGFALSRYTNNLVPSLNSLGNLGKGYVPRQPDLILEFNNLPLDPLITFTRASSGMSWGSDGVLKRTGYNLLLWSEAFNNAAWNKVGSGVAIAPTFTTGIADNFGGTRASRITFTNTGTTLSDSSLLSSASVSATGTCVQSFYVKGTAGQTICFRNVGATSYGTLLLDGTWQRAIRVETFVTNSFEFGLRGTIGSTTGTVVVDVYGVMLESGYSTPGEYSKTTTAVNSDPRIQYDPAVIAGYGSELVTNGTFNTDVSNWTQNGTGSPSLSVVAGQAVCNSGSTTNVILGQAITTVIGRTYFVSVDRIALSSSAALYVSATFGGTTLNTPVFTSGLGTSTYTFVAVGTTSWVQVAGAGANATATLDNISVREANFTAQGLLIEAAATNLLTAPRDGTNAAWIKTFVTAQLNQIGIDGVSNSATLVTTSATSHIIYQSYTCTPSTVYTYSFFAARGTMTDLKYSVHDYTGSADIVAPTSYYSQTTASGFKRITLTFTTPPGCVNVRVYVVRDSGVTGTMTFDYAQLETGSAATSPVIGTRAADIDSFPLAGLYNDAGSTLVVSFYKNSTSSTTYAYLVQLGADTNRILLLLVLGNIYCIVTVGGVQQSNTNLGAYSTTAQNKVAISFAAGRSASSSNGAAIVTGAPAALPTLANMPTGYIGHNNVNTEQLGGSIPRLTMYASALPDATLQALSA